MKIFIVIDSLGSGGAQRQVVEYLKNADRMKFDITVVNLDVGYDVLGGEIRDLGYDVVGIAHKGLFNLRTLMWLVVLFRKEKPDVVHTYLFTADCYGRLAAWLAGVKRIICSVRGMDYWKKAHHIFIDRIFAKFTHQITINAELIRPLLVERLKINAENIIKISNGIDLDRFRNLRDTDEVRSEWNIPKDALVVGMVGRFVVEKDYETFFEAAQKVEAVIKNVYLLAIGYGARQDELEVWVKDQKISANIVFTGLRKDVPDQINAMDIAVLSSHNEGCPNVVLEYMACAKPVIATSVGACPELIVEGKTGYLVPETSPDIMADRMIQLLKDGKVRENMGAAGRRRIEKYFTSTILATNIEKLYIEL